MKLTSFLLSLFISMSVFADLNLENSYIAHVEKQINSTCSHSQEILDKAAKEFKNLDLQFLEHSIRVPCTEGQKPVLLMELLLTPQTPDELKEAEIYLKKHDGKSIYGAKVRFEKFQISYGIWTFNAWAYNPSVQPTAFKHRVAYADFSSMVDKHNAIHQTFKYRPVSEVIKLISNMFVQDEAVVKKSWEETDSRTLIIEVGVKTRTQEFVSWRISYRFGVYATRNF
jgi:hypothetical protein